MLTNFLEKSKPINFMVYLGIFFLFFVLTTLTKDFGEISLWFLLVKLSAYLLLFLTIFFFYNFIITKNKLTFDNSYAYVLFSLALIIFLSDILDYTSLFEILIQLLFLRKVYSLKSHKKVIQKLFDSGFWLGILFLLESFSILFLLLIYAAILLHQKLTIYTLFTPIIGFVTPVVIYFSYLFWNEDSVNFIEFFNLNFSENLTIHMEKKSVWQLATILGLSLIALIVKSPRALSVNNSFKKSWILLIINLIIALFFAFFIQKDHGASIIFISIPASVIIANGFEILSKKIIKDVLFILLFIGSVLSYFSL